MSVTQRRETMAMKFMVAAAAVLAVLAGPALAGDQDLETELRDSGRYVPQANLPEVRMPGARLRSGPYALAIAGKYRPLVSGLRGRQVEAPPWSFACMTDHGPRPCREPMWVYD
jgi:hypothetical protein